MRRVLLGSFCAAACCANAFGQSSVTAYGLIDMSVNYAHVGSAAGRPSANISTLSSDASRFGFRGTEDLGGGLNAYFRLESGFSFDTGIQSNATQFFNRESYVGLGSRQFGSIQLGSQFSPAIWSSGKVDPFARFGLGSITGLLQGSPRGWAVTLNNAVQYITPDWGGAVGKLVYSPSEGAATGRSYAASAEYTRGPVYATLNYDRVGFAASSVGLSGGTVFTSTLSAGGTYNFGPVKVAGWYQDNRSDQLPSVNGYMLGATVPVSQGEFRASLTRREQSTGNATQAAVGYYYFLSKRTQLYSQLGQMKNTGASAFGLGPGRVEETAAGLLTASRKINGVQLGIRHYF